MTRLLVVEDDENLRFGIVFNLQREGYDVLEAGSGEDGIALLERERIDGIVLDVMLPGMSGFDVLQYVQRHRPNMPVLVLSARSDESDAVTALEMGAQDYVRKPFGLSELVARLRVVLRRREPRGAREGLRLGPWELDLDGQRVRRDREETPLTTIECDLLRCLLARRGDVCKREDLLATIWGVGSETPTRTLDNHVARLRKKLEEDPAKPRLIVTVHGVGYRAL